MRRTLVIFCMSGIVMGSALADPENLGGGECLEDLDMSAPETWALSGYRAAQILQALGCGLLLGLTPVPICTAQQAAEASSRGGRTLLMHSDGTYETAYSCAPSWCAPSDYGSFAERYEGCQQVCAIVLDLTATIWDPQPYDLYIWADEGGAPGEVVTVAWNTWPESLALWPQVARNILELPEPVPAEGVWWVGCRMSWGGCMESWTYIGADLNGPGGGCPMTKIAPGQGYPEGWQNVSVVWGPTAALGIGVEVEECPPSPASSETWGGIKALFR